MLPASVVFTEDSDRSSSTPLPPTATLAPLFTLTPTVSPSPTWTSTPTQTPSPTLTPTPTWVHYPAGEAEVLILLYHHVAESNPPSRYFVSPQKFEQQMGLLRERGYTTIPISQLVAVLREGGELPQRPIVITFDDGDLDVYENAFPVMQELGMIGVVYVIANRLEDAESLGVSHLEELLAAGWEVGSHSMSHPDLTLNHNWVRTEVLNSRLVLEEALGVSVLTFAYPFGQVDPYVAQKVQDYGYRAGLGLGVTWKHSLDSLFYLSRREVYGNMDVEEFAALLPP
ncbi:MAG: polysaccharide deacetylase family protein [Chloroflexota bacterium]